MNRMPDDSGGIVYVLRNEAMPGYVKIGKTQQNDVGVRVRQLDNTSVPVPFECYFAARVPDCHKLEQTLHFVFGEKRARRNREFFTADPDLAKAIIELVALEPIRVSDAEQDIDASDRREIEILKKRREVRTFTSLNVPMGAILTFTKDPAVTCTVVKPRKVNFNGEEMSPSAAALKAIHAMGYQWPAVSGMDYWAYDGVKLCELTDNSEQEAEPV